jgi:hypothetical protein
MSNAEVHLGDPHPAAYGVRWQGQVVEPGERPVEFTLRLPHQQRGNPVTRLDSIATGLFGDRSSVRRAALEAVKLDGATLTYNYNNGDFKDALQQNADTTSRLVNAIPGAMSPFDSKRVFGYKKIELEKSITTLSMAGPVTLMAFPDIDSFVTSLTLVAPPKLRQEERDIPVIARRCVATALELGKFMLLHPNSSAHMVAGSAKNLISRPKGVGGEIVELTDDTTVVDYVSLVKKLSPQTHLRLVLYSNDFMVPAEGLKDDAEEMDFDDVWLRRGGHLTFLTGRLMKEIILGDKQLAQDPPPPLALAA